MWQKNQHPAHTPTFKAIGPLYGAENVPLQIVTLGIVSPNGDANGSGDMTSIRGKQGECELCGRHSGDLRLGACAPCRKRYSL